MQTNLIIYYQEIPLCYEDEVAVVHDIGRRGTGAGLPGMADFDGSW